MSYSFGQSHPNVFLFACIVSATLMLGLYCGVVAPVYIDHIICTTSMVEVCRLGYVVLLGGIILFERALRGMLLVVMMRLLSLRIAS